MLSNKQINKQIQSLVMDKDRFDLRRELRIIASELDLEDASNLLDGIPEIDKHLYAITSSIPDDYCGDMDLALSAAKRIADKNDQTFVLSLEDGTWKAAFGSWNDCAEYSGGNPAYCSCIAILKYMGRL